MNRIFKVLTRKKIIDQSAIEDTQLQRVLNKYDLTALGVGSTLGVGVYVLVGHVAKEVAGPAVVLSFFIAAIASVFAGLCYAEFGARVPRAGSAYIYSYICIGEFVAFVIGWNLILEYVIGSASVAKGITLYIDSLVNNTIQNTFIDVFPINVSFLAKYFDPFSFLICLILAMALAFGMKESSMMNNVFTSLNICIVLFVVIAGSFKVDFKNWNLTPPPENATFHPGAGGFFPFGIGGVIKGAATCFYGFIGFDCIATTGEEVLSPQKAIPFSIILSLLIIFLSYFGISTIVTLLIPYYLQNSDAPLPYAFEMVGLNFAKWLIAIGGICGLFASLFGAIFPLPRIIYAMASDGVIFRFLGKVSERFQTPVMGTLLSGLLTGLMAGIFELKQLVNMMSIGTLLAYTIVAISVLLLRYEMDHTPNLPIQDNSMNDDNQEETENNSNDDTNNLITQNNNCFKLYFNIYKNPNSTKITETIVFINILIYCILCILIGLSAIYLKPYLIKGHPWAIIIVTIIIQLTIMILISIARQPMSKKDLTFKVPFVPLVPALSILFNIYLMLMLDTHTWIRFAVWMILGFSLYGFYGFPNSMRDYMNYIRLE